MASLWSFVDGVPRVFPWSAATQQRAPGVQSSAASASTGRRSWVRRTSSPPRPPRTRPARPRGTARPPPHEGAHATRGCARGRELGRLAEHRRRRRAAGQVLQLLDDRGAAPAVVDATDASARAIDAAASSSERPQRRRTSSGAGQQRAARLDGATRRPARHHPRTPRRPRPSTAVDAAAEAAQAVVLALQAATDSRGGWNPSPGSVLATLSTERSHDDCYFSY
jgi:hypothetical protein